MRIFILPLFMTLLFTTACQNAVDKAVRKTKYSAWELIGVEKRDLFRKSVTETKNDQQEAQESFQDALEKLKSVYNFDGGKLEKNYSSLKTSFDDAKRRSDDVHASVKKVNTIAGDLFVEWQKEIDQISTPSLRAESAKSLARSKNNYAVLEKSLKQSEKKLDPVLTKLNDHVLFLKHNLNAKAITSLKKEHVRIESDIQRLIKEMNESIAAANVVIDNLEKE